VKGPWQVLGNTIGSIDCVPDKLLILSVFPLHDANQSMKVEKYSGSSYKLANSASSITLSTKPLAMMADQNKILILKDFPP
jgi:hypothetical protein